VPWTADHPPGVAKNTSQAERAACVKAANAALEDGKSDEDAIFACIGAMNNVKAEPALTIKKQDDALQVVWGEVYAPGFPDSQGDFMTAETVREMAWRFMRKSDTREDRVGGSMSIPATEHGYPSLNRRRWLPSECSNSPVMCRSARSLSSTAYPSPRPKRQRR
jgi:hypothetical protein